MAPLKGTNYPLFSVFSSITRCYALSSMSKRILSVDSYTRSSEIFNTVLSSSIFFLVFFLIFFHLASTDTLFLSVWLNSSVCSICSPGSRHYNRIRLNGLVLLLIGIGLVVSVLCLISLRLWFCPCKLSAELFLAKPSVFAVIQFFICVYVMVHDLLPCVSVEHSCSLNVMTSRTWGHDACK